MSTEEMNAACDNGAEWTLSQASQYFSASAKKHHAGVSFDDIADWYTNGGYSVAPWLELLDLSKWVVAFDIQATPSAPPHPKRYASAANEPAEAKEQANGHMDTVEPFCFELSNDLSLKIIPQDATYVLEIATATGLSSLTADELYSAVLEVCRTERISKAQFNEVFRSIVPTDRLTDEDKALLTFALSNIFYGYDVYEQEQASLRSLVAGLSVLCAGTKSSKLAFGFQLFDADGDGCLRVHELQEFLTAYLKMLFACSFEAMRMDLTSLGAAINKFTFTVAREVASPSNTAVDFPVFGEWYNEGGFTLIPWLELLDLSKWQGAQQKQKQAQDEEWAQPQDLPPPPRPQPSLMHTAAPPLPDHQQQQTKANGDVLGTPIQYPADDTFVFTLNVDGEPLSVPVTTDVASAVCALATQMGTQRIEPEDLAIIVTEYSDDGLLSKQAFDRCMRKLKSSRTFSSEEEKTDCSRALSTLYYGFDRAETELVDVAELVCGFAILCKGTKSAKLAFAFDFLDEDGDGLLTRRGLWRYFRSFLCAMLMLSGVGGSMSVETMCHACDSAALWTCVQVFKHLETKHNAGVTAPDRVTFDDIAEWYTDGGFEVAPWLELLDIRKWTLLLGPAARNRTN
jgi:Ca2+-binding EF-hand superfamily protein